MHTLLKNAGTRLTLFAVVAWQMCVAPMWVCSPATEDRPAQSDSPPIVRCAMICLPTDCAPLVRCVMPCRTEPESRCERVEKNTAHLTKPTQGIEPLLASAFAPPLAVKRSYHSTGMRITTPTTDLDSLRTVILIM